MIVMRAVMKMHVILFCFAMMMFFEVDTFHMSMMSKTELIAVSGNMCALCISCCAGRRPAS